MEGLPVSTISANLVGGGNAQHAAETLQCPIQRECRCNAPYGSLLIEQIDERMFDNGVHVSTESKWWAMSGLAEPDINATLSDNIIQTDLYLRFDDGRRKPPIVYFILH